jgi:DNA gyrase subunit A
MVQRTAVRGISQQGRAATGVRVMNIRDEDKVSAVALVVESEASTAAQVAEDPVDDLAAAGEQGDDVYVDDGSLDGDFLDGDADEDE